MTSPLSDLSTAIGDITLKNPLICGAGEHLMEENGLRAALEAGAGAVVIKSTNESVAAKEQLLRTDYALLDSAWNRLPWDFNPPADVSLFCRSGLAQQPFDEWLALAEKMDKQAYTHDAYLIASLIPADIDAGLEQARQIEAAGLRILEVNIGAPHGEEAARGAIALERDAERVRDIVGRFRNAVSLPLWIKLTGQSGTVDALAEAAQSAGADAVTVMGRFMGFLPDVETQKPLLGTRAGLGGPWALPLTCFWLQKTRERLGPDFPLIATNGARSGLDLARFMLAGAAAIQMTTAIFTGGFAVIEQAIEEFKGYLAQNDQRAGDLIGRAADRLQNYHDQPMQADYWKKFVPESR